MNGAPHRPLPRGGFTLAELLVGIALVAVASGAILGFYRIGIDTERRTRERSESSAALRIVYKLLDERMRRRESDLPSLYLKAGAFAALGGLTSEILARPLDGANPALEIALGLGDLAADGIAGGTVGALLATLPGGRLDLAGPIVLSLSCEVSVLPETGVEARFPGGRPDRLAVGGFAPGLGSVAARPAWRSDTVETNDGTLHDLSPAPGDPPGDSVSLLLRRDAPTARFLAFHASTGSVARPAVNLLPAGVPVEPSLFHVRGCALLSDDGILFPERGPEGLAAAHALYLRLPPEAERSYDEEGAPLLELRYAFSVVRAGAREVYDESLIGEIRHFRFVYYDGEMNEIVPGASWAWLPGDRVAAVAFVIELHRCAACRAEMTGWRP